MKDEGYGTTYRETMKKSMSRPAEFKPLNRVQRPALSVFERVLVVLIFLGFGSCAIHELVLRAHR